MSPLDEVRQISQNSQADQMERRLSVRPGGGSARPRSKYNAPVPVSSRYRQGNRRWSSYDAPKQKKQKVKSTEPQFWTTTATVVSSGYGGSTTYTYSCTCPDKARQVTAGAYGADEPPTASQYTPRVFKVDSYLHYRSDYIRFQKGRQLLPSVDFIGIQGSNTYVYKFPTDRIEKYNRNWTSSQAGLPANKYCKHIWAVIFHRGDPYVEPDTLPDYLFIEDTYV